MQTRIIKNTSFLYVRMFIIMMVSLYTSRIVLQSLGVQDYGIVNIVGGIVVSFSFFNTSLTNATQRFLNFELGRGDHREASRIFATSLSLYLCIIVIIFLLSETLGLWFLNSYINIPPTRLNAANYFFQFSILTFCSNMLRIPYNAAIIAYERMDFYAYVSVFEGLLLLLSAYLLMFEDSSDRLVLYSILLFVLSVIINLFYYVYCRKKISISRERPSFEKRLFSRLMSFSGWTLCVSSANLCVQQVSDLLLNLFCGLSVNAVSGIANQVSGAMFQFVSNFQIAYNPQIVKLYASGRNNDFFNLIIRASKISFFLFSFLVIPFLLYTDFILGIWLGRVPPFLPEFCRLLLIYLLIDSITGPLSTSIQATGDIKYYQLMVSSIMLVSLPIIYFVLDQGYPPYYIWAVRIFINLTLLFTKIYFLGKKINLPVFLYLKAVLLRILVVVLLAFPIPYLMSTNSPTFSEFISVTLLSIALLSGFAYFLGFNKSERNFCNALLIKGYSLLTRS